MSARCCGTNGSASMSIITRSRSSYSAKRRYGHRRLRSVTSSAARVRPLMSRTRGAHSWISGAASFAITNARARAEPEHDVAVLIAFGFVAEDVGHGPGDHLAQMVRVARPDRQVAIEGSGARGRIGRLPGHGFGVRTEMMQRQEAGVRNVPCVPEDRDDHRRELIRPPRRLLDEERGFVADVEVLELQRWFDRVGLDPALVEQGVRDRCGQPSSRRQLEVLGRTQRRVGSPGRPHPAALHEGKATVGVVRLGTGLEYQLVVDGCCGNTVGKA